MDQELHLIDDDFLFYSLLYSSITVVFAMAVMSKFVTNELRFGVRSVMSLAILFVGEPMCHFLLKGAAGVFLFGAGCLFVYSILPASHLPAKDKIVLVTGCDCGFGYEIAKKLDSIGMRVFAGCLYSNGPGAIGLTNSCSERLTILQMDVSKEEEVDAAHEIVSQQVGDNGLWGVVNNAAIWYIADIEMTPESIFRRTMEVNLFGTMRVTKRFLPLVKQAKGRVVNMSSLAGKIGFEGMGCYTVSKFALEGYTDTLRLEMKKWGVTVATVEPSGYKTGKLSEQHINDRKEEVWKLLDDASKETYGSDYVAAQYNNFAGSVPKFATDLTPVIRAVRSGLLSKRPLQRYHVGRGVGTVLTTFPLLPVWLADYIAQSVSIAVSAQPAPKALVTQAEARAHNQQNSAL